MGTPPPRCGSVRREVLDRLAAQVDERHVLAVERLEVVGAETHPLRADRVVLRRQGLGGLAVADDLADLAAEESGERIVRPLVGRQIVEATHDVVAAERPACLVALLDELGRRGRRGLVVVHPQRTVPAPARLLSQLGVVGLERGDFLDGERARCELKIVKLGVSLEDDRRGCLLRDQG